MSRHAVANRVFVAYPWKTYKSYWEPILRELHKKYPLHYLAIGRDPGQPAAQLLTKILAALEKSSIALMDASGGNANVSLEYGYAKARLTEDQVYMFLDDDSSVSKSAGAAIISDLAGTVANRYTFNDQRLHDAVDRISRRHPYVKRYERFCRRRKFRGGTRRFLLRVLRQLDGADSVLRRELIDNLVHEAKKDEKEVTTFLKELHEGGLITVTRGNNFSSRVSIAG